jgi:hypothetical protein
MGAATLQRPLASVEGVINYVDPTAPIGGINDVEREKSTFTLISHPVRIRDVRPVKHELDLETTGFVLVDRPTAVSDFADPVQVEEVYLPECAALVRELSGADKVVVFGQVQRDGALKASPHRPVYNAHVDYNVETIRAVAARLLPPEELERRRNDRIVLINVWRPIETIESAPLAICDAASVQRQDLVFGPIGGNSAAGVPNAAGWNLAHNPAHRWCYVPRMRPEEVLVFKLCDTDQDRVQWTAHTAFDDPTSAPDARPRRSIELRTLAFIPQPGAGS